MSNSLNACFVVVVVAVQLLSHVQPFVTPWTAARQPSLSFTVSWSLLKLMSIESVLSSSHLVLCHPLLFLTSIFPSIKIFSNESALCSRWPKYWNFRFSLSLSNKYSGLISPRIDWSDLLSVHHVCLIFVYSKYTKFSKGKKKFMNKHSTLIDMHAQKMQKTCKSTTYIEIQKKKKTPWNDGWVERWLDV